LKIRIIAIFSSLALAACAPEGNVGKEVSARAIELRMFADVIREMGDEDAEAIRNSWLDSNEE